MRTESTLEPEPIAVRVGPARVATTELAQDVEHDLWRRNESLLEWEKLDLDWCRPRVPARPQPVSLSDVGRPGGCNYSSSSSSSS